MDINVFTHTFIYTIRLEAHHPIKNNPHSFQIEEEDYIRKLMVKDPRSAHSLHQPE